MPRREITIARSLRRRQTEAELRLWSFLRDRRLHGWKFRRQVPVKGYVGDFLCKEAMLIVEIDGSQHAEARSAPDATRTAALESAGYRVLRFWNNDVFQNLEGVLTAILAACGEWPSPQPSPVCGRGSADIDGGA